jgi:hypothetical protein
MKKLVVISLVLVFAIACDNGGGSEPGPDTASGVDVTTQPDTTVSPDTAPADAAPDVPDGPSPFMVGTAEALLPAPLGIPVCGNMPDPTAGSKSPYCANFPGTETVYLHPTLRAIALRAADERLVFLRADLLGIRPIIIHLVEQRLSAATGEDWTDRVFIGATHTHSSAGRIMPGTIWEIMVDEFFPQLFWRLVDGFVQVSLAALDDLEPGAFGYGEVITDALHNDRRCENPPLQDDRLRILRFDGEDGELKALLLVHSLHGTVIGSGDLHFSRDALGGVEEKVREAFDHPVTVMFWQAGAGDMAPADAATPPVEGLDLPLDYWKIEGLGAIARDLIGGAVPDIETRSDVTLASTSTYARLDREALGYAEGEFPFEGGGAYCEKDGDQCYDPAVGWTPIEGLDQACLDVQLFLGESLPRKFYAGAARVGDLLIVSYPGEPVTSCTLEVEETIKAEFPDHEIVVVGYAQDYIGYSTPEDDWWQGAYEASGALWGPKQGDYVTARVSELGMRLLDPEGHPLPFEPPEPFPVPEDDSSAWTVSVSVVVGTVVTEPADVAAGEVVVFEFTGGDPWLLLPTVVLETQDGDGWAPVTWSWGGPVDGTGYEYLITLHPDPDYGTSMTSTKRTFTWRVELPTRRHQTPGFGELEGTYRFHVTGLQRDAGTLDVEPFEVTSKAFAVTP